MLLQIQRMLAAVLAKTRQFMGIVMLVVAAPAVYAGVVEWRRGSDVRLLAVIYSFAGLYLAYEGFKLIRRK